MSEKRSNPNFSKSQAAEITKRLFGLTPSEMDPLPSYYDQNFYVTTAGGAKYVLKIFNFKDSENPTLIGVQVQCMSFLYQNGLPVPTAVPTTSGQLMSLEEAGYLHVLDGDPLKEVVEALINQYKTSVIPKRSSFCSSLIHADLNDLNILVQPDENGDHLISGIVDFSDMQFGYYIYELAITIMYMMMEHPNPIEVGGPVLAGWESVLPLNEAEKDCLYTLVISRFCQSCVLARYLVLLHPENAEYVISTSEKGIPLLHQLWERGKEEVEKVWFEGASQYNHEKKEFKVLTSI
ncbi:Hydroxylysine kinase [Takifugu flavidus]|uniref:Hydroxylysine kinase n=1 Tax=Takifugu flavidus TaxID=433684 RepID=A0A5C6MTL6_9TELE|nr:Hydroxylysine kinase [Takifugu flavidus]